jgi:hypothetical protein
MAESARVAAADTVRVQLAADRGSAQASGPGNAFPQSRALRRGARAARGGPPTAVRTSGRRGPARPGHMVLDKGTPKTWSPEQRAPAHRGG